jgi:hypothetical protein
MEGFLNTGPPARLPRRGGNCYSRKTGVNMTETAKVTMPGIVQKIILSPDKREPEKAEIAVQGADPLYKEIRIENNFENPEGNQVKLKAGAHVAVTVEAEAKDTMNVDK